MQAHTRSRLAEAEKRLEGLREMQKIALRRARLCDSEAVEEVLDELSRRREAVRDAYSSVDTSDFPNKVVATISALQGQEREIAMQVSMWKNAKGVKKDIDDEIRICENSIIEMRKHAD
jgi:hypothetical protein